MKSNKNLYINIAKQNFDKSFNPSEVTKGEMIRLAIPENDSFYGKMLNYFVTDSSYFYLIINDKEQTSPDYTGLVRANDVIVETCNNKKMLMVTVNIINWQEITWH